MRGSFIKGQVRSLVALGMMMVSSPDALAASGLIIAAPAAEATPLLLVPRAEALAAKGQVLVLDNGRLNPGVEGLRVGQVVVVGGRGRGGRGRGGAVLLF